MSGLGSRMISASSSVSLAPSGKPRPCQTRPGAFSGSRASLSGAPQGRPRRRLACVCDRRRDGQREGRKDSDRDAIHDAESRSRSELVDTECAKHASIHATSCADSPVIVDCSCAPLQARLSSRGRSRVDRHARFVRRAQRVTERRRRGNRAPDSLNREADGATACGHVVRSVRVAPRRWRPLLGRWRVARRSPTTARGRLGGTGALHRHRRDVVRGVDERRGRVLGGASQDHRTLANHARNLVVGRGLRDNPRAQARLRGDARRRVDDG